MKTYFTRVGWIVGPMLALFAALAWCANAWLLGEGNSLYQLTSALCPGALLAAIACALLPGPRFEITQAEMDRGMGQVIGRHTRGWQLLVWIAAFAV